MGVLLAKTFDPDKHDPTGWWMSEKLDGVRAIWTGEKFVSRTGKPFFAPAWFYRDFPKVSLDGEFFIGRGRFQDTVSVVRKKIPVKKEWIDVWYWVFDAPDRIGPFEERMMWVKGLLCCGCNVRIRIVQQIPCAHMQHLLDYHESIKSGGGEGVMLREPGSFYVPKRSGTLLKVKEVLDGIAVVTGHQPGEGKHTGRLGALLCRDVETDAKFKIGTGFSDVERESPPANGDRVRYAYQELTQSGVPRFPRYLCVDKGD